MRREVTSMPNPKQLHITFVEPNTVVRIKALDHTTERDSNLSDPIVFHVGGKRFYLRRLSRVHHDYTSSTTTIVGAGTVEPNSPLNHKVSIVLNHHRLSDTVGADTITFV